MTSTIRVTSPQDLLALIPVLAGYRPERSLVCLAFREDRVVGVLRYDLPRSAAEREPLANAAVGVLCRIPDADGLVLVTFSAARFRSRAGGAERALLRFLMRRAREAGFAIRDALRVAADGWGSLLDAETPAEGRSLELVHDAGVTRHPAIAAQVPGDLHAGATVPDIADGELERVRVALCVLDAEYGAVGDPDDDPRAASGRVGRAAAPGSAPADPVDLVETLLTRPPDAEPTNSDVARIAWLARLAAIPVARDAMMLQIAFGPVVGRAALAEFGGGDERADHDGRVPQGGLFHVGDLDVPLGRLLLGETSERPDVRRAESGTMVLLRAAASARSRERAGLLCMAAWLVWALGRGSAAARLLHESLDADPGHRMAALLARYFATGALPDWAFRRTGPEHTAPRVQCPTSGAMS